MKAPKVSAIVPNLNMGRFIGQALESMLKQTLPVDEVIVVDNGSTDDSLNVIESFEGRFKDLKILSHEVKNPASVRNVGIQASRGDVLAFLDADDLWHPEKIAIQRQRLLAFPDRAAVGSHITFFQEQKPSEPRPAEGSPMSHSAAPCLASLLVRKSVFDEIGLLNDELFYGEDWDLYFRLRDHGTPFVIQKWASVFARKHDNSMTSTADPRSREDVSRAIMESILRRRKLGLEGSGSRDFSDFEEDLNADVTPT